MRASSSSLGCSGDLEDVELLAGIQVGAAQAGEDGGHEALQRARRCIRAARGSRPAITSIMSTNGLRPPRSRAALFEVVIGGVLHAGRHGVQVRLLADGARAARHAAVQEGRRRQRPVDLGVNAAATAVNVVVRTGHQRLGPGHGAARFDAVLLSTTTPPRPASTDRARCRDRVSMRRSTSPLIPSSVGNNRSVFSNVSTSSRQFGLSNGCARRVGDPLSIEVIAQVVNALSDALNPVVLGRRDVPGQHVHHAAVLGKRRRDFFRDEEVGPIDQLQGTINGVVIRQRHQRHAARLAQLVLAQRIGVAFGAAEQSGVPLVVSDGSRRMDVEIAAGRAHRRGLAEETLQRIGRLSRPEPPKTGEAASKRCARRIPACFCPRCGTYGS